MISTAMPRLASMAVKAYLGMAWPLALLMAMYFRFFLPAQLLQSVVTSSACISRYRKLSRKDDAAASFRTALPSSAQKMSFQALSASQFFELRKVLSCSS